MPSQITYESPPKQGPHVDKLVMTARQAWQLRLPPTEKGTRIISRGHSDRSGAKREMTLVTNRYSYPTTGPGYTVCARGPVPWPAAGALNKTPASLGGVPATSVGSIRDTVKPIARRSKSRKQFLGSQPRRGYFRCPKRARYFFLYF
jgi:hypothetical protein